MIESLAYVGFNSPHASEWETFGPEVLGLQVVSPEADGGADADGGANVDGTVRLRLDDVAWRIAIHPGEVDDLAYTGWTVADAAALQAAVDRLKEVGVDAEVDEALAAERGVDGLARVVDPFGFRHELVHGLTLADSPFEPGRDMAGGFVTGEGGLGHIVLIVPDLEEASAFYLDTFGFEHSDDIDMGLMVRFAHCNPRHHSLAFSAVPGMTGVHHLMLEVERDEDVGRALDIVNERGHALPMGLGRHTNDQMFSFYVRTPSGFEIEYGSGGRLIDTSKPWVPEHFDAMSEWGHKPPPEPMFPGILKPLESPS